MTSVTGWHTGRLWSMTLSASLRTVILCFSLLPYYKNPFLDLGKNIVKWLGQCFLPELARSFLLNRKYNDTVVPLCLNLIIADGSVEFCEATPIGLVDELKVSLYGRETDQDLRSACRCVA